MASAGEASAQAAAFEVFGSPKKRPDPAASPERAPSARPGTTQPSEVPWGRARPAVRREETGRARAFQLSSCHFLVLLPWV
eukprot:scaffold3350_cov268-Pinguiococcus_pyrenoidosus.AAC.35